MKLLQLLPGNTSPRMTGLPGLIQVDHRHVCGKEGVSNRPAVLVRIMKVKLVDQLTHPSALDSEDPRSSHSPALWSRED